MSNKFNSFIDVLLGEKTFCLYVISCMVAVPLTELISEIMGYQLKAQQDVFAVFGIIGLFLCATKIALRPVTKSWQTFFFLTLHIFMFLSLIFSQDIARVNRNQTTNEYPIFFVGYYCLMFAAFQISTTKLRKYVLFTFISLALSEGILAVLQTFRIRIMPVLWQAAGNETNAFGLTHNTNLWGGLSVIFFGATVGAYIFAKKNLSRVIFGIISVIAAYASFGSNARLAWVGDFCVIVFYLVSLLIMRKRDKKLYASRLKAYFLWLSLFAGCIVVAILLRPDAIKNRIMAILSDFDSDMSENHLAGSGRFYLWNIAWQSFKKHWVFGVGLDNLKGAFTENPLWFSYMKVSNQAHNEYLQVLATQGLFAFINYFSLLLITLVKGIKRVLKCEEEEDRVVTWIFLSMLVGYMVASFFLFRAFNVVMYFFIVIGMINPVKGEKKLAVAKD